MARLNAADSEAILQDLPRQESVTNEQIRLCLELLRQNKNASKRSQQLQLLFSNEAVAEQKTDELFSLVEVTLAGLFQNELPPYASVVSRYPTLRETLVSQAETPALKDQIRLTLVRNVSEYSVARHFPNVPDRE